MLVAGVVCFFVVCSLELSGVCRPLLVVCCLSVMIVSCCLLLVLCSSLFVVCGLLFVDIFFGGGVLGVFRLLIDVCSCSVAV